MDSAEASRVGTHTTYVYVYVFARRIAVALGRNYASFERLSLPSICALLERYDRY